MRPLKQMVQRTTTAWVHVRLRKFLKPSTSHFSLPSSGLAPDGQMILSLKMVSLREDEGDDDDGYWGGVLFLVL